MSKSRLYGLVAAATFLAAAACQSTQSGDTGDVTAEPTRTSTANATDSAGTDTTTRRDSTTPPSTPPGAR